MLSRHGNKNDILPVQIAGIGLARTMTGFASASGPRRWSEGSTAESMDLLPEEASRVTDFLNWSAAVNGATMSSLL